MTERKKLGWVYFAWRFGFRLLHDGVDELQMTPPHHIHVVSLPLIARLEYCDHVERTSRAGASGAIPFPSSKESQPDSRS